MKSGMTIEYLKCRADLNFEVDFGVNRYLYDSDQVGSYFIRINKIQEKLDLLVMKKSKMVIFFLEI